MSIAKIFILTAIAFAGAFIWAPILVRLLHYFKMWRKPRELTADGRPLENYKKIEKDHLVKTPRGGGLLIWITISVLALVIFLLNIFFDGIFKNLNFLSRAETWLPIFTLAITGLLGLADDILTVKGGGKYLGGGISLSKRIILVLLIGLVGAWWFHFKLGWDTIHIPFFGDFYINGWYMPIFAVSMVAVFSSGVIDGIDGMSGGVFAALFMLFGVIAFLRGQFNLAAFCSVMAGTLAVFLWFNAPPAKFYLGEAGILPLTTTLTVIAFLTNAVFLLPIAGIMLVITTGSDIVQLTYRKFTGKKLLLVAPIHHHWQLKGVRPETVVIRYWIVTGIACIVALMIYLLDKGL
jgi:phospho-N-acetylmuramoyl-pentapeptide-transferase